MSVNTKNVFTYFDQANKLLAFTTYSPKCLNVVICPNLHCHKEIFATEFKCPRIQTREVIPYLNSLPVSEYIKSTTLATSLNFLPKPAFGETYKIVKVTKKVDLTSSSTLPPSLPPPSIKQKPRSLLPTPTPTPAPTPLPAPRLVTRKPNHHDDVLPPPPSQPAPPPVPPPPSPVPTTDSSEFALADTKNMVCALIQWDSTHELMHMRINYDTNKNLWTYKSCPARFDELEQKAKHCITLWANRLHGKNVDLVIDETLLAIFKQWDDFVYDENSVCFFNEGSDEASQKFHHRGDLTFESMFAFDDDTDVVGIDSDVDFATDSITSESL